MPDPSLPSLKARLRAEAFARRDALAQEVREEASRRIAAHALSLPELETASPVGSYWPIRSEVDPRPLMDALHARGQALALSQILHPHLQFRLWSPDEPLLKGSFGVMQPGPEAAPCVPQALLMPLAAFDRRGGRLGYGKGHFDRAIAAIETVHPVLTIGLAFAAQEIGEVPQEDHDRPLDVVVTEEGIIRPHREGRRA